MTGHKLSAEELVALFSGQTRELPQRGGSKDNTPDGTWLQDKRIEHFHKERLTVLNEERVKKQGSLATGTWRPDINQVELTSYVGKYWQRTGHMADGKFMLYPEEALALVDKGDLEVYYEGLPLSVQECYPTLLGSCVPLEHYQVYSHLTRLGYVVFRHTPVDRVTKYQQKLGLNKKLSQLSNKQRKKKRRAEILKDENIKVPKLSEPSMDVDIISDNDKCCMIPVEKTIDDYDGATVTKQDVSVERVDTTQINQDCDICELHEMTAMNNLLTTYQNFMKADEESLRILLSPSDFSDIDIPSLVPGSPCEFGRPQAEYLPCGVVLNQDRYVIVAPKYTPAPHSITSAQLEYSHPTSACAPNTGTSVLKAKARNWREYKQQQHIQTMETGAVGHLWQGEVTPLVQPSEAHSSLQLLDRLKILQNVNFTEDVDRLPPTHSSTSQIIYDVYKPDHNFSKTQLASPLYRLCIARQDSPCIELNDLVHTQRAACDGVPVQWAVVDNGSITFYSFHGVNIPTDVIQH